MKKHIINTYACINDHVLITRVLHEGTTPMTMKCLHCGEVAKSAFYKVDQSLTPTHEWYMPLHPERIKVRALRKHCNRGGLLLRGVGKADASDLLLPKGQGRSFSAIYEKLTNGKELR